MDNIISSFYQSVEKYGDKPCIWFEHRNIWRSISWNEFANLIWSAATGLKHMGIKKGDRVAIFGPTAWEWTWADMALLTAGAIVVPIYPTIPTKTVQEMIDDSEIKLVVGSRKLWKEKNHPDIDFLSWRKEGEKSLGKIAKENQSNKKELIKTALSYSLNDPATIVYTSGTTGNPKGAIITHSNIAHEISAVRKVFLFPPEYIGLACLPLSHVLGRMLQFYQLAHGCQTAYVPDLTKLAHAYKTIKPHYFCTVPRLLEKIEEGVNIAIKKRPLFEQKIFSWAKTVADEYTNLKQWKKPINTFLRLKQFVAYFLIFRRIRKALGGRIKSIICGGAPLSDNLAKLLFASKISILEGYGLTETFAAASVNRLNDFRIGTVGKPVEEVEIKFSEENELLMKGGIVFPGYWQKEKETESAFTADGWFKTGDLGEFTRDGFVRLTGRIKDIIVTSGGKNISPVEVEDRLKEIPFITQSVLYGDGRKFLSAIVAIDPARLNEEAKSLNLTLNEDLTKCSNANKIIQDAIDSKNEELASFERVRKFVLIPRPLSVDDGELTPSLKVRRSILAEKHKDSLDALYN